jgi:hypothetical protein
MVSPENLGQSAIFEAADANGEPESTVLEVSEFMRSAVG